MKLTARREDGSTVKEGDAIRDFRGEDWTFVQVTSISKVYARNSSGVGQEFYPQVFRLHLVASS